MPPSRAAVAPDRAAPPAPPPTPEPAPAAVPPAPDDRVAALQELRAEVLPCIRCKLHQGRMQTVFGEGDPFARVMFVGEAPGAREDESGRPFVGPAGQLLDRILSGAMGLQRDQVFIANINKCRPPGNRAPEADEVAACLPFLRRQVELIRPEVIVCLGRTAAQNLLGSTESTRTLRSGVHDYAGIPVVVTWHPAYLLREPSRKRETWDDIKKVNRLLGLPEVPGAG
ncbi:MAG: uracil-DNA glycosylase [Planctomycetes bacterium]|nr:uracil-DNA glycosylase [Planctomycetota bacterium]